MCNSQKKGLSTKSLNGQTIIDATDALDADSDHESSPRLEDYLEPFAGRTVRGALDGSLPLLWSELKALFFKHAISFGYSAYNLPAVSTFLDLVGNANIPKDRGYEYAEACILGSARRIYNNMNLNKLAQHMQVGSVDGGYIVYISKALQEAVHGDELSFDPTNDLSPPGNALNEHHAEVK